VRTNVAPSTETVGVEWPITKLWHFNSFHTL